MPRNKAQKVNFTQTIVAKLTCPPERNEVVHWDAQQPGLGLRVRQGGGRTWICVYRPNGSPKPVWHTIGRPDAIGVKAARDAARRVLGEVAAGGDPHAEHRAKRKRIGLQAALDAYEEHLTRRQVAKRAEVLSLLRRELLTPLGNVPLADLGRVMLADRINEVEKSGRAGAARELKARTTVFFNWAVGEGKIGANPLAGWKKPRATRAERLKQTGRSLSDDELARWWRAVEGSGDPIFAAYLKFLLLTGQRRTETAMARWSDLELNGTYVTWTIPAEVAKSGREQKVPLPPQVVELLQSLPRFAGSDLVFPGRAGLPIRGWSKRLPPVYAATAAAGLKSWTMHDLRRTFRSGLSALRVDRDTRELMIGHVLPGGTLTGIYDLYDRWPERVEAANRWADKIQSIVVN